MRAERDWIRIATCNSSDVGSSLLYIFGISGNWVALWLTRTHSTHKRTHTKKSLKRSPSCWKISRPAHACESSSTTAAAARYMRFTLGSAPPIPRLGSITPRPARSLLYMCADSLPFAAELAQLRWLWERFPKWKWCHYSSSSKRPVIIRICWKINKPWPFDLWSTAQTWAPSHASSNVKTRGKGGYNKVIVV